ncbi:MAG: pyrimidine 5'-nucleotidase [Beijerinckiaceae bacterium]
MNHAVSPHQLHAIAAPRGFGHVDSWIFDLDNTLYPHDADLWPQIDSQITAYVSEKFGLDGLSSRALQKYWYQRYGTTLRALMDEHDIDPHEFLSMAHDIDRSRLLPNPALGEAIAALPGRKFILTNGDRDHAEKTILQLGIDRHFEGIFGIVEAGFVPKPQRATYEKFLGDHAIDASRAAMFEDLEKNLTVPHALGMTTVLVVPAGAAPHSEEWERDQVRQAAHSDWVTAELANFLTDAVRAI